MTEQSVFDYKGQKPDGVEKVLLSCAASPVFLVVRETLLILTQPIDSKTTDGVASILLKAHRLANSF